MSEHQFELEKTAYFKKRSKLLRSNGIPKLSDAKQNLGETLANVVFKQCDEALREVFGVKVPLKGPGDELWVSPSDLLNGKIALKPPFTPKCLQALTHQGILKIGEGLEKKFRDEMEKEKLNALEKYKTELTETLNDRLKTEVKDVEIRERMACHMEIEKQQQDFEVLLKKELDKLEAKIRKEYAKIAVNYDTEQKAKWQAKLQLEAKKTMDKMTKDFSLRLQEQEEDLTKVFHMELRKQEFLRQFDANYNKRNATKALKQLKHNLECNNLVNMMYVLCTERKKCCQQKQDIEAYYQNEIEKLEIRIIEKDEALAQLTVDKEKEIREVSLREACLKEVLKQFQKFINFALRAAPTQAEFLLSVEKMMVFELATAIEKTDVQRYMEAPRVKTWSHEGLSKPPSKKVSTLQIKDHHDCFNELNPPSKGSQEELNADDVLPAMYLKNKTYVREDFRDMLAGGVPLSPSNELWNHDVEIMVENWREQTDDGDGQPPKKPEPEDGTSMAGKMSYMETDTGLSTRQLSRSKSIKSCVQFNVDGKAVFGSPEDTNSNLRKFSQSKERASRASLKVTSIVPFDTDDEIKPPSETILAAADSVELLIEKRKKSCMSYISLTNDELPPKRSKDLPKEQPEISLAIEDLSGVPAKMTSVESKPSESKELVQETRDSIIMRKSEMAKTMSSSVDFSACTKDSLEIKKDILENRLLYGTSSRLNSARNSVEILRESLFKLREPSPKCERRDLKKQHEHKEEKGQMGFATICCERCKVLESAINEDINNKSSLFDTDERSVKISRIEVINLDSDQRVAPSSVSFIDVPDTFPAQKARQQNNTSGTVTLLESSCTSTASYNRRSKKKTHRRKKESGYDDHQLKIAGDIESKEGNQSDNQFTAERIHSLIKLMSDQPYLLQLFTAGTR